MARPMKEGLYYFPMDVDIFENMKVRRLMRKYKITGFSIYVKILCDIYRNSYYLEFTDDYLLDLADEFEQSNIGVARMVSYMVKIGLFDEEMWKIHILTEEFIQERYFAAKGKYFSSKQKNLLYIINPLCMEKYGVFSEKLPQRKENKNKSKVNKKESKENFSSLSSTARVSERENFENREIFENSSIQPISFSEGKIFDENLEEDQKEEEENCAKEEEESCAQEEESFFKKSHEYQYQMLHDQEWLYSVSHCYENGDEILRRMPDVMKIFDMHLVTIGETETILNVNDYKRRFLSWWRCMSFDPAADIVKRNHKQKVIPNDRICKADYPASVRNTQKLTKVQEAMIASKEAAKLAKQLLNAQNIY